MGGKGRCNPASEYVDRWVQARRLLGCGEEPTQSTAHRARCPGEKLKYVFTLMNDTVPCQCGCRGFTSTITAGVKWRGCGRKL